MYNKYLPKEPSQPIRRFQHRRIQTQVEETNNKFLRHPYYKIVEKQYSKPKFIETYSKVNTKQFQKKNAKTNCKNKLLFTKHIRTQPNDQISDTQRAQQKNSKYQIDGIAGKGTFGVVYYGRIKQTGQKIALKKVLQDKKYKNRQLDILKMLQHPNVLEMKDYFITYEGSSQYLNVVMDYYSHNLYQVIKRNQLTPLLIKLYTYQILRGLNYLAGLSISHRDIKPQNILVDRVNNTVVICDFGSAKKLVKTQTNIAYICSRCYRAPQLIFGATDYTPQIDMWSIGCVIIQMINGEAPFLGDSQLDQLLEIIKVLGTPQRSEIQQMNYKYDLKQYKKFPLIKTVPWNKILKTQDPLLVDLIHKIMQYSPVRRLSAAQALQHSYFDQLRQQQTLQKIKMMPNIFNFTQEQKRTLKKVKTENPSQLIFSETLPTKTQRFRKISQKGLGKY